ncbi:LamG-like jellyroll fold domain-containing protein [Thalassomonas actiniarum]|uniref:FG-GAP repeat protein n=1 Tax=Thalassomonas actiniarum TaxID=485447 RepID=A0AAE9YS94_9GAMM|nr:LamG-like jellyroll fold domain-containing protein [Thalassomonas actiniarum]WDE00295.1 FG-GAP repeat protein [Thalassomonas actiniarum]
MFKLKKQSLFFALGIGVQSFSSIASNTLTLAIDENTAAQTVIGQITVTDGATSNTVQIDVGKKNISNWSTRKENYETVNFNSAFAQTPIVFSQLQSDGQYRAHYTLYNDTSTYKWGYQLLTRTRQQNPTTTGFQSIIESSLQINSAIDAIDNVTGGETVGWIAFAEAAQGIWQDRPFEVNQTAEIITENKSTFNFSGPFYQTPTLFTSVATSNDSNQVDVSVTHLSDLKTKLFMDELDDGEHDAEAVSLLMLQGSGTLYDSNGATIGESGIIEYKDNSRSNAATISLLNHYTNPVVFVQPVKTSNEITDAAFRFTDISSGSFSGYLHADSESTLPSLHGTLDLHYYVFEAGSWTIPLENYSYAISSGNDSGAFAIDADNGEISVANSSLLDFESGVHQYVLTVQTTDGQGLVTTTIVTVNIKDITDSLNNDAQTIKGLTANDWTGWAVAPAGDVNGDSYDDIIIGAPQDDTNGGNAGRAYVLFGNNTGVLAELTDAAQGINGFVINGAGAGDKAGFAVNGGVDINGDGLSDLVVGAPYSDGSETETGTAYVVFGKKDTNAVELADIALDSDESGFAIYGKYARDQVGGSIVLGDVNGDGLADIILGEIPRPKTKSGISQNNIKNANESIAYVVYGKRDGTQVQAADIISNDNDAGFVISQSGRTKTDTWQYGTQVLPVGDFNSDGLTDFIVSQSQFNKRNPTYSSDSDGVNKLVYGRIGGSAVDYDTISEDGNGFDIIPETGSYGWRLTSSVYWTNSAPGFTTSAVGDVNGDGIDDIALVAPDDGCCSDWEHPRAYIIFGNSENVDISLSDIAAGNGGFVIHNDASGVTFDAGDRIFGAIGGAGDLNGDGYDDVIIGDQYAETKKGRVYTVYGKNDTSAIYLSDVVNYQGGFYSTGNADNGLGHWISSAGDINGDSIKDILFGTPDADANDLNKSGALYVLLGNGDEITLNGTQGADNITGAQGDNIATGGGDDMITKNGAQVVYSGPGNDTILLGNSDFLRIDGGGGTDTIQLTGSGITLNLATASAKVRSIEVFDIGGTGANILSLNKSVSSNSQVLIKGDSDDLVYSSNQQWMLTGTTQVVDGVTYQLYSVGSAQLWIQTGMAITVNNPPTIEAQTFSISEYSLGGSTLGTLTAVANDVGDSVTFTLVSGNESGKFALDPASGELSISESVARLDYEEASSYTLNVRVTDLYGESDEAVISVKINDLAQLSHILTMDVTADSSIWGENVVSDMLTLSMAETVDIGTTFTQDLGNINIDTSGLSGAIGVGLIDLQLSGTASFSPTLSLSGGWVNADLPLTLEVSYPDEVEAGNTVKLSTNMTLDEEANFVANSPSFNLAATLSMNDVHFKVASSLVDSWNGETTIDEGSYTKDVTAESITVAGVRCKDANDLEQCYTDETNSDIDSLRLVAKIEQDEWINKEIYWGKNWEAWYAGAGFQLMQGSQEKCNEGYFYPAGEDLFYRLNFTTLDTFVSAIADLYQEFSIEFSPMATLTLEDGTEYIFDPRDNLEFTPEHSHDVNGDGIINASLSVDANPVFNNESTLSSKIQLPFKVVEVSYNVQEAICTANQVILYGNQGTIFEKGSFGPFIDTEFNLNLEDLTLGGLISTPLEAQTYTTQLSFDLCNGTGEACGSYVEPPANTAPTAANASIEGTVEVGYTLTGSYTYSDNEDDQENGSSLSWQLADDSAGSNTMTISGENAASYTIVTSDAGKHLRFCVVPNDGIDTGTTACSDWALVEHTAQLDTAIAVGFNQAIRFDGENQYARIPMNAGFDPSQTSFTIETWFKADEIRSENMHLIQQSNSSGTGRTIFGVTTSGKIYCFLGGSSSETISTVIPNTWNHVAVTFDIATSTLSLYLNGKMEAQSTNPMEKSLGDLILGAHKTFKEYFFAGAMDETRLWNIAKTADEIKQGMALGASTSDRNLQFYFNFDDSDTASITDMAGNYNMDLYGSPTSVASTDRSLSFDGNGDYVEVTSNSTIEFDDSFTVEAWVYADANSLNDFRNIVSKKEGTDANLGWLLRFSQNSGIFKPTLFLADGTNTVFATGEVVMSTERWYHIAGVVDRSSQTAMLYVDGELLATESISGLTTYNSPINLRLGTWSVNISNRDYWMGEMDDVRLWKVARSQSEIQQSMYSKVTDNEANLVANYQFNQIDKAQDSTTNGNDGRFYGSVAQSSRGIKVATSVADGNTITGTLPGNTNYSYSLVDEPAKGTVSLTSGSNEFTYTASDGATGTDSFSYQVFDSTGNYSYTERVTITIE